MAAPGHLGSNGNSAAAPAWTMAVAQRRANRPASQPAVLTLAMLPDVHIVAVGGCHGEVALYILQVDATHCISCMSGSVCMCTCPLLLLYLEQFCSSNPYPCVNSRLVIRRKVASSQQSCPPAPRLRRSCS